MDITPDYDSSEPNILGDESLAPLKRNHACLQCKKRKVKCDAIRPTCNPCLRSHAHALRSAQRNKTARPPLICTYADEGDHATSPDEREASLGHGSGAESSSPSGVGLSSSGAGSSAVKSEKKKSGAAQLHAKRNGVHVASAVGDKSLLREKDRRIEEERDTLKARIAELEAKLSELSSASSSTPPIPRTQASQPPQSSYFNSTISNADNMFTSAALGGPKMNFVADDLYGRLVNNNNLPTAIHNTGKKSDDPFGSFRGSLFNQTDTAAGTTTGATVMGNQFESGLDTDMSATIENGPWDFSEFLLVPLHWPKNLPGPVLLEHLVDTFFNHVPQLPRMIHRTTFMARLKLPPSDEDFPFPGLLHAMCSVAAPHTAVTNSIPPVQLDAVRQRYLDLGLDLETCEDFGLAQAESAERAMRHSATSCIMGPGSLIFDMLRAHVILSVFYFSKGLPLRGWILGGTPGRLIQALELGNRNVRQSEKPGILPEAENDREREERYATVWMAFVHDAGFSINSAWSQSMSLDQLKIPLPTSNDEFRQRYDQSGFMQINPQNAHDPAVLIHHPIPDPFVLVVKAAILLSRVATWIREWQQRDIMPGDDMEGVQSEAFIKLNNDIFAYQLSVPSVLKNVNRILDSGHAQAFDVNLLSVHIFPHVALLLLHELFVDWAGKENASLNQMQKAYEAVVGFVHLIPSQLDVTLVMTPLLTFCIYTVGRIVAKFVHRALSEQQFGLAVRYRADLFTLQNILARYGAKFALGLFMSDFLEHYIRTTDAAERLRLDNVCGGDRGNYMNYDIENKANNHKLFNPGTGGSAGRKASGAGLSSTSSAPSLSGGSNASPPNQSSIYSTGSSHVTPEHIEQFLCPGSNGDNSVDAGGFDSTSDSLEFDTNMFEAYMKGPFNSETKTLGVGITPPQAVEQELYIPMCMDKESKLMDYADHLTQQHQQHQRRNTMDTGVYHMANFEQQRPPSSGGLSQNNDNTASINHQQQQRPQFVSSSSGFVNLHSNTPGGALGHNNKMTVTENNGAVSVGQSSAGGSVAADIIAHMGQLSDYVDHWPQLS